MSFYKKVILVSIMLSSISIAQKAELVKSEFIFQNPQFKSCHASTIVELGINKLMAAWFGGSYEGANDVCIWTSICEKSVWEKPIKTANGVIDSVTQFLCWNSVLFKSINGKLFLFYKVGKNPREWWGVVKTSNDNGQTWSGGMRLSDGFLGPIKDKPIQLKSGEILCPSSVERTSGKGYRWTVHLEITNEHLDTWRKVLIDTSSEFNVIQPTILQFADGRLEMLCRSQENIIVETSSSDNGKSWSKLTDTNLPNPNSGIDAVTLSNGLQVLVFNLMYHGKEWVEGRNVLIVVISKDGEDWTDIYTLKNEKKGEFSYPAVIQTSDEFVHITYTYNRKNIKHVVLSIE